MSTASPSTSDRLVSLDAFRGLTIAGMILVNNPGDWSHVYPPLLHAKWHGWTPTDLIFPFFLFIMGVSMNLSMAKRQQSSRGRIYLKILSRTLVLFGLGLFLNAFPAFDLGALRIPGVLQRIALVYFFGALIVTHVGVKAQAGITAGLLLLYWALMALIPVPPHGAGDLSVEGNLAAHVDNALLHGHMWRETWDPEGLLSTIPAIATGLLGYLAGFLVRSRLDKPRVAGWMFLLGSGGILLGLIWDIWFPINKNLWTSSYVLFTAGAALEFLGVCYWLIDSRGWRKWAHPAVVFGMNALAVYVISGVVTELLYTINVGAGGLSLRQWLYETLFASWASPYNASLFFAIVYVLFWWAMMDLFYRRRIFIKI
jgi:predicted acyltransferase